MRSISRIYDKLLLKNDEKFTIPDTATLFCSGGGYFRKGIAIGNNNSNIPGSMRYNNGNLQVKISDEWLTLTGFFNNNCLPTSLVVFGENGNILDSEITLEDSNINNVNQLETEFIVPPINKRLILGNIKWPELPGGEGDSLIFTEDGDLQINTNPLLTYNLNYSLNNLLFFDEKGRVKSSDISVYGSTLTSSEIITENISTETGNINISANIVKLNDVIVIDSEKMSITNNGKSITFLGDVPATSTSPGNPGDFSWDENFMYVCVSENVWKRTPLSSW